MKAAVPGANWSPCAEPIDQTVVPATGLPSPSVQVNAVPPHSWTSIPRCCLYQACSAGASLALKKMPPMPVTRFIEPPRSGCSETWSVFFGLRSDLAEKRGPGRRNGLSDGLIIALVQWADAKLAKQADDGCRLAAFKGSRAPGLG